MATQLATAIVSDDRLLPPREEIAEVRYVGWIRVLPRQTWQAVAHSADDVDCWRELYEYARQMWPHRYRLRGLSLVVLKVGEHPTRPAEADL